ncbi:MAG: AI-2E family transporter [Treponema sp.]|nr:AI-2E family transporter [Treponema sp.]
MADLFKPSNSGRARLVILAFICSVVVVAVLKLAAQVLLPITIGILLALVLYPLVLAFNKLRIPRIISIVLVVMIIAAGLYALGMVIFSSGRAILSRYPRYESRLTEIYVGVANFFNLSYDQDMSFFENVWNQIGVRQKIWGLTYSLSNAFIAFLGNALIILFLVLFLLIEASQFNEKIELAFAQRSDRVKRIGVGIMNQVARYLAAKFFVSLLNGLAFAVGLSLMEVEFALVWAVIQFILNFIPSLGSIASGFMVSLFALLQFWPEPGPIIMVVVFVLAANLIIGYILDPKVVGDNVGISPLAALGSVLLWGWLWGFAGMVLAVPMMCILKIICENFTFLEPVSILLSSKKAVRAKKSVQEAPKQERTA